MLEKRPNKQELLNLIESSKSVWGISELFKVSNQTISNWLKKEGIVAPKGFYSRGLKVGRPAGFKHSEEWKEEHRKRMLGESNPFFGKAHSVETKEKMSNNHADFSGEKNPFRQSLLNDESKRKEHKERCLEIWSKRDALWRRKFAEKLSARPVDKSGGGRRGVYESGLYISNKAYSFWYRSSWERIVAEFLDDNVQVSSYKYESERVVYKDIDDTIRRFISDFIVEMNSGHKILLEIKPRPLIDLLKWKIVSQYEYALLNDIQYYVVSKREVFSREIFDNILDQANKGELYALPFERCGISAT